MLSSAHASPLWTRSFSGLRVHCSISKPPTASIHNLTLKRHDYNVNTTHVAFFGLSLLAYIALKVRCHLWIERGSAMTPTFHVVAAFSLLVGSRKKTFDLTWAQLSNEKVSNFAEPALM